MPQQSKKTSFFLLFLSLLLFLANLTGCETAETLLPVLLELEEGQDLTYWEDQVSINIPLNFEKEPPPAQIILPRRFKPPPDYRRRYRQDGWDLESLDTGRRASFLTPNEKDLILVMNMVRTDPLLFANLYVREAMNYYHDKKAEYPGELPYPVEEGRSAVAELYRTLRLLQPAPPLEPSEGMHLAALDHAANLRQSKKLKPVGTDQSTPATRLERYGQWHNYYGESYCYGHWWAHRIIMEMLIDDGQPTRLNRKNILDERFRFTGVALRSHPFLGSVTVINFTVRYDEKKAEKIQKKWSIFQPDTW